jgi:hypothetical protein
MEALRQLKDEIGDGLVRLGWGNSQGPKDRPDARTLSTSQLLLIGTGIAPDVAEGIYRRLLVDGSDVQRLWPLNRSSELPRPTAESTSAGTAEHKPADQPDKPRPASPAQIRSVAREVYADPAYEWIPFSIKNRQRTCSAYPCARLSGTA